jgi:hypothetical protein
MDNYNKQNMENMKGVEDNENRVTENESTENKKPVVFKYVTDDDFPPVDGFSRSRSSMSKSAPPNGYENPDYEEERTDGIVPALDVNFGNMHQDLPKFPFVPKTNLIYLQQNDMNDDMTKYTLFESFVVSILNSFKYNNISSNLFNDNIINRFIDLYFSNIDSKYHNTFNNVLRKYNLSSKMTFNSSNINHDYDSSLFNKQEECKPKVLGTFFNYSS